MLTLSLVWIDAYYGDLVNSWVYMASLFFDLFLFEYLTEKLKIDVALLLGLSILICIFGVTSLIWGK